jgi:hypothetical protein
MASRDLHRRTPGGRSCGCGWRAPIGALYRRSALGSSARCLEPFCAWAMLPIKVESNIAVTTTPIMVRAASFAFRKIVHTPGCATEKVSRQLSSRQHFASLTVARHTVGCPFICLTRDCEVLSRFAAISITSSAVRDFGRRHFRRRVTRASQSPNPGTEPIEIQINDRCRI